MNARLLLLTTGLIALATCHRQVAPTTSAGSLEAEVGAPDEAPPQTAETPGDVETFAEAAEAFAAILRREPSAEVIGLGEYHQTTGAAQVPSSLERFTRDLLPLLAGKASDLVIETWVAAEGCGGQAKQVAVEVQEDTRRPDSTEAEVVGLIKTAQTLGLRPHILELSCEDYRSVYGGDEVDYDRMLQVLARLLREKAIGLRDLRARRAGRAPSTVVLYGGHLHNDLDPEEEVAPYSYGPELSRALVGYYLEVDLFVPELIEGDRHLPRQPWFRAFLERQSPDHTLLIRRGPSSYVLVFNRSR